MLKTSLTSVTFRQKEPEEIVRLAARAGLEGEVIALPVGRSLYAYWADSATLTALFGADPTDDLRAASWAEWSDAAETLTAWLAEPSAETVTLNGQDYTLPESRPAGTEALTGVFALPEQGRAAFGMPLFTGALLAAGDTRTEDTLTGPLNGVYSALTLELQNRGGDGAAAGFGCACSSNFRHSGMCAEALQSRSLEDSGCLE